MTILAKLTIALGAALATASAARELRRLRKLECSPAMEDRLRRESSGQ